MERDKRDIKTRIEENPHQRDDWRVAVTARVGLKEMALVMLGDASEIASCYDGGQIYYRLLSLGGGEADGLAEFRRLVRQERKRAGA